MFLVIAVTAAFGAIAILAFMAVATLLSLARVILWAQPRTKEIVEWIGRHAHHDPALHAKLCDWYLRKVPGPHDWVCYKALPFLPRFTTMKKILPDDDFARSFLMWRKLGKPSVKQEARMLARMQEDAKEREIISAREKFRRDAEEFIAREFER